MVVLAGVAVMWSAVGQGSALEVKSSWSATPVKVSGTGDGWSGNFMPVGDPPLLVSVENDAQYLYLCVRTSDPKAKSQIGFGGLTVWAEVPKASAGGMGLRFPMRGRRQGGDRSRESSQSESPKAPPLNAINDASTEFELLGPTRDDSLAVQRGPEEPVQVAIGDDSGVLVYEVRLPLLPSDDHPVAIGAAAGTPVAVTLDTTPPKRQARPEGEEGSPEGESPRGGSGRGPGGGYGPGGGMGGAHGSHGGGHFGGGPRGEGFKPFKVNLAVTLAPAPAPAPAPAKPGS
jgi:uncharacterized membrane protein YgcG